MLQSLEAHIEVSPAMAAVLRLLAQGESDEEMAAGLQLKVATVRTRLRRFYEKTGLSGRRAVAWAVRHEACCLPPGIDLRTGKPVPLRDTS